MSSLRYTAKTHTGLVRKLNEDSVLALPEQKIWVIADGMGGHEAGDLASQLVVDRVAMLPLDCPAGEQMQALREALRTAHRDILVEIAARNGATIGAAVVALMIAEGHFVCFWAGDCRLYRLRDGTIELLTSDHSLVGEFVRAGQMTWDEAESHPQSNAITRAVGVGEKLELDKVHGHVSAGDRYLLCSDGLNKYAGFDRLRRALTGAPIEIVADRLLDLALAGGGADNVSVIVIDVV